MKKHISAIILAGGAGERFAFDIPKQFVKVAGRRVIEYTLEQFQRNRYVDEIVVVVHPNYRDLVFELVKKNQFSKVQKIVNGGETRQESSYIGLQALPPETTHVLIHDAARPFVTEQIINTMVKNFARYQAIDTVINTADTIVKIDQEKQTIVEIPERRALKRGQTPQGFQTDIIRQAHERARQEGIANAPDDCSLVLRYQLADILVIPGDEANIKITYPLDIYIADKIFQLRRGFVETHTKNQIKKALQNKTVVIFGGSRGIGAAISNLLTGLGACVYAFGHEKDIRNFQQIAETLQDIYNSEKKIDVVINTAGRLKFSLIEHEQIEKIKEIIETNLVGSMVVVKAAIPYLKETQGHLILFTSSSYTRGREGYTPYSASKAGVVNFVQGVSEELLDYGIKINVMNPERTRTPMRLENFGKEDESLLLKPETVAIKTLSVLLTQLTGQVIDVRKDEEAEILKRFGWSEKSSNS